MSLSTPFHRSAAPEITTVPLDTVATVNKTIVLDCAARGIPLPVITWWKATDTAVVQVKGERISVTEGREDGEVRSTLEITMAQIEDAGVYICRAENNVHTDEHMANVTVGSKSALPLWYSNIMLNTKLLFFSLQYS